METVSIFQYGHSSGLNEKVDEWLEENKNTILEIVDIEYQQYENVYVAIIRYIEKEA